MEILTFIISCVNLVLVIVAILKYKKLKDFVIADTVSRNEWDTERKMTSDNNVGINCRFSAIDKKYKELDDRSLYYDDSISELKHGHETVSSKIVSLDRDYNKALTGINDLYSIVDGIRMRMAGTIDANDKLGQENKNLEASSEEPIEPSDPFKSVVNTNLGPFGPREWPRDMVVGMDIGALNNASDNENSDEPAEKIDFAVMWNEFRDRVVNVNNNIHTSPTFWSKEDIDKHINAMNEAVDSSDSDQFLIELKTTMSMFADNDKFYETHADEHNDKEDASEEAKKDKIITTYNAIDGTTFGVEEVPAKSEENNG